MTCRSCSTKAMVVFPAFEIALSGRNLEKPKSQMGAFPVCRIHEANCNISPIYAPGLGRVRFWHYLPFGMPFGNDG